jgi:hypothetical protein
MPATSTTPAPLEGRCLSRRDCEMPASSRRRLFDRSDQINQNSRGGPVSPRGAGQTKQKAISLRCRKIRIVITEVTSKSKLALLIFTRMYLGIASRREPAPRCVAAPTGKPGRLRHFIEEKMVEPDGIEPTTSCLQSRRSPS